MKTFKFIDAWVNLSLIIFFIALCAWRPTQDNVFIAYFIVGGWQVISMIVHAVNKWFIRRYGVRHIYHWITLISLVTFPVGSYWILLFTAPFMAIFYTWICFDECAALAKRPISVLR